MYYKIAIEFTRDRLHAMKILLEKAQKEAMEKGISDEEILAYRLAPDMFALIKQVQISTDNAKWAAARLAGVEIPKYEDDETTLDDLYARIDKTIAFLDTFTPESFRETDSRKIELPYFKDMHFTAEWYISYYIANFMFHVTTTYALLRANGFQIGKADFMSSVPLIPNS
jgi:uncharacterized protein